VYIKYLAIFLAALLIAISWILISARKDQLSQQYIEEDRAAFHNAEPKVGVMGAITALISWWTKPPPKPTPEPTHPWVAWLNPKPATPALSIALSQTKIRLSWNATEQAEYYPVYAYNGFQWQYIGDITGTGVDYDYQQQSWDPDTLQLKILACKAKPWWLFWAWWQPDRCSNWSNAVNTSQYLTHKLQPNLSPVVTIDSPASLTTVGAMSVSVSGEVSDSIVLLTVNDEPIAASAGRYSTEVNLREGRNTIIARAIDNQNNLTTASISVFLDLTPPIITVASPAEGETLYKDKLTVTGLVDDIVRGTIEQPQVNIIANGILGTVSNGSYSVKDIPLQLGDNTIILSASDQVGNTAQKSFPVRYELPTGKQLQLIEGQNQSAQIATVLDNPLRVKVVDDTGAPVGGETVVFRVVKGAGTVAANTHQETYVIAIKTDTNGEAQTRFRLGPRVGRGNHKVRATITGSASDILFSASGLAKIGNEIGVNSPGNQRADVEDNLSDLLDKEKPCFNIHTIKIIGERAEDFSMALDAIYTQEKGIQVNPLNHCIGAKSIKIIMKKVQNRIISAGYITTRIMVQPQNLNAGLLNLTVIPGVINDIVFVKKGDSIIVPVHWNSMPMKKGKLLNLRQIEQGLENYKRVPSVDIDIKIVPTQGAQAKPGQSDLVVNWQQKKVFRGYISVDNSGSKNTGIYKSNINVSMDNLLGMNDIFSVSMGNDLGGGNKGNKGTKNGSLHYSIPFDNRLISFVRSQYEYHQTVRGATQDYLYNGRSHDKNLTVSQMLYRNAKSKTKLNLSLWTRESNNFVNNTEIYKQQLRMDGYDLSTYHSVQVGKTQINGTVTYRKGTKNSPDALGELSNTEASHSKYYMGALQIKRSVKVFNKNAMYQLALKGQLNSTALEPQDRFSIGSRHSVRGYSGERTLSAERGYTARNELIFSVNAQQIYLAADYGKVSGPSSKRLIGQHLSGWGAGVRGQKSKVNYGVFVGLPMDYPDGFKPDSKVIAINIGASF